MASEHEVSKMCRRLFALPRIKKSWGVWSSFRNLNQTVARARFHIKIVQGWHVRSSAGFVWSSSHCQRCAIVSRFTAMLLHAMRVCNPLWQNSLARPRAGKHQYVATFLASGIAAGGCKRIVTAARQVVLDHSAILVRCGNAAVGC